jgi:type III secretion protein U
VTAVVDAVLSTAISLLLPLIAAVLAAGFISNFFQVGVLFAFESIKPDLKKVSPGQGIKKIISIKNLIEFIKSIVKIAFLGILVTLVIMGGIGTMLLTPMCGMDCVNQAFGSLLKQIAIYTIVAFLIIAFADFVFQRFQYTKSLKMTKDEVKREYKESEGDPIVKGQRKQLAQEFAMSDTRKQVGRASAVVVNPTHLAVAIRYDPETTALPLVVAKGRMLRAQAIRVEAERAGVPIFRNVPLARQLFADVAEGDYVPDELFDVVAEILAWVSRNEALLHKGPLTHGDLDMERGDHRSRAGRHTAPRAAVKAETNGTAARTPGSYSCFNSRPKGPDP